MFISYNIHALPSSLEYKTCRLKPKIIRKPQPKEKDKRINKGKRNRQKKNKKENNQIDIYVTDGAKHFCSTSASQTWVNFKQIDLQLLQS